jgi:hypothetical protein
MPRPRRPFGIVIVNDFFSLLHYHTSHLRATCGCSSRAPDQCPALFWDGLTLICEFEGREPPDLFFLGSPAKPIRSGIPILRISALRFAIALTISHA